MKIRNGFVSNSSSSSFICEVCGEVEESYDGMSETGMIKCKESHIFCGCPEVGESGTVYDVPQINCPICSLKEIVDSVLIEYLEKKYNFKKDNIISEIKTKFNNLKELRACISIGEEL